MLTVCGLPVFVPRADLATRGRQASNGHALVYRDPLPLTRDLRSER